MYRKDFMPKHIKSTTLRDNLSDTLDSMVKERLLIITKRNQPVSALVDLDYLEDLLATGNPSYLKSIRDARADAKAGRVFTHADVFGDLD